MRIPSVQVGGPAIRRPVPGPSGSLETLGGARVHVVAQSGPWCAAHLRGEEDGVTVEASDRLPELPGTGGVAGELRHRGGGGPGDPLEAVRQKPLYPSATTTPVFETSSKVLCPLSWWIATPTITRAMEGDRRSSSNVISSTKPKP